MSKNKGFLSVLCSRTAVLIILFQPYYDKFEGSNPSGVTGIFHGHNPSCRTMALRSNQSLKEMSTWNTSWGVKAVSTMANNLTTFIYRFS